MQTTGVSHAAQVDALMARYGGKRPPTPFDKHWALSRETKHQREKDLKDFNLSLEEYAKRVRRGMAGAKETRKEREYL